MPSSSTCSRTILSDKNIWLDSKLFLCSSWKIWHEGCSYFFPFARTPVKSSDIIFSWCNFFRFGKIYHFRSNFIFHYSILCFKFWPVSNHNGKRVLTKSVMEGIWLLGNPRSRYFQSFNLPITDSTINLIFMTILVMLLSFTSSWDFPFWTYDAISARIQSS